jgi:hypothetical protein
MSFTLVINSKNTFGSGNNCYKYDFIQGNFNIPPDSEVMVANVQIPYSFYNITQAYNNNSFQFSFPTATYTYATSTITIPDGFYTTTSLNYYLQQWMISNGYYLINGSGQNVYYYTMQYNSYQYGNQLLAYTVPTSLPSGYSLPTGYNTSTIFGGNGFPTVSRTPFITILGNNFGTFLGYTAGSYPIQGSGANIVPVLSTTSIASFTINNSGSGYQGTLPIVLTGGGGTYSGFTANVVNGVITSINAGTSSGYTSVPTVSITGGGGSGVNITCVLSGNTIGTFTIVSGGTNYTSTTPVTITQSGATASGYVATVSATGTITAISGGTSSGFSYFTTPPVISITTPVAGINFSASAVLSGTTISSLTINNGGINYSPSTQIAFSGGGGSGATAIATVVSGSITAYTSLSGGSGYTSLPSIVIYSAGSTVNYSGNSPITPVGSTVNSIILRCSLVDNKVSIPMDILDSFTIGGVGFGQNINYSPQVSKWVKLSAGSFSNFYITFCDQNLNTIAALDNNIMVTLLFRLGKPKTID